MDILLVRHGEILSNLKKVYAGKSSEALTEKGVLQAEILSQKLKSEYNVHAMYSSPIQRAVQTAELISELTGIDYKIDYSFRELEMGPWEGMAESEVAEQYPEEWEIWNIRPAELKLPGRETLDELLERVLKGLGRIYDDERDRTIVVVTHVAIIRVLLLWHAKQTLNGYKKIYVPNAEVFEININTVPSG